jgi:hypothetical protein
MTSPICLVPPTAFATLTPSVRGVRPRIRALLSALYPQSRVGERRGDTRFPFPYLLRLTPVASDGRTPLATSVVVAGKDISEHGLGFYHPTPLPFRRVVATIVAADGSASLEVLMDLNWCRFTREGWYDGGGRFLEEVVAVRASALSDTLLE